MERPAPPVIETLFDAQQFAKQLLDAKMISKETLRQALNACGASSLKELKAPQEFQRFATFLHVKYMLCLDSQDAIAVLAHIDGGPRAPATHQSLDRKQREIESLKRQLEGIFNGPDSETIVTVNVLRAWAGTPEKIRRLGETLLGERPQVIDMLLFCPNCAAQHIDAPQPDREWDNPPHRTHECQACLYTWRPSDHFTNGIAEIKTAGHRDQSPIPMRNRLSE